MRTVLFSICGVGLVLIGLIYGLPYFSQPDIDKLVGQALSASTEKEKVEAAQELSGLGEVARAGLSQLLVESENEKVVSVVIVGLARLKDYDSMELILAKLDDSSVSVRSAAANASTKLLGRNHHFPASGTATQRARVKAEIEKDWEQYSKSDLFEYNKQRTDY